MCEDPMPELSIIVPVYKVEPYLSKCIDSILAQTYTDFELILIDDGSPDNCGKICDEYEARDSRIIVIHQENQGVSAARNAGLNIAVGEYIGFVDSDDWIEPEMYGTMIGLAKAKELDVVMCGVDHWSESGKLLYHDLPQEKEYESPEQMVIGLFGTPNIFSGALWNKVFSARCASGSYFDQSLEMAEDWIFLVDVLRKANRGEKIAAPLYNYLERENSITRSQDINIVFDHIYNARYLLFQSGQLFTKEIASASTKKYLDDCLRYTPELKQIGQTEHEKYRSKIFRIKCRMMRVIIISMIKRTLPLRNVHGILMETIRL